MFSDAEFLHQFDDVTSMFGQMDLSNPCPQPPEQIIGNHGEDVRIFHSRAFGLHNHFPARFTLMGKEFHTVEQYVVWQKAKYFGDLEIAEQVLRIKSPLKIRRIGQRVRGFRLNEWQGVRDKIMYVGLRAKFTQNLALFQQLRATGEALLAEASMANPYWTNGVARTNMARLKEPASWTGENRLGTLLMDLREEMRTTMF